MDDDEIKRIGRALVLVVRRANDPRGNAQINAIAGTQIERASAVLLARLEALGTARLSELADAAGIDVSTASRQVARLVEQGYVDREPDPRDGRAVVHRLSPAGQDLRNRLSAAFNTWLGDLLTDFSQEELVHFAGSLECLVGRIVSDTGEKQPPFAGVE